MIYSTNEIPEFHGNLPIRACTILLYHKPNKEDDGLNNPDIIQTFGHLKMAFQRFHMADQDK
jgi:hypothetical protein